MSSSLDDPTATNPQTPSNHSERTTTLINEIRHLEKSTNEALRTTQDELERLESTSSQTRSTIDHLERKLKVLEKQNNNNGYTSRRNSDNSNGGGGGGVNKRLNSFLNRSITIHGGNEQLEELRSRRSLIRRGHSISNLRESMRESIIGRGNNSNDAYHHHQDGPPPTTRRRNRSSMNLRSSTMSRSINTSGHSFSLGVSNHTRLTHLLSGLATHDSGDEESSTCSDATALDLLPSSSSSSSSSSCDSDDKGNSSTQSCSLNKQQLSQINELSSTLQLKKDQLNQLQHDQQTNATKLSMVQSKLYKVHREHRQLLQDHECKMKVLQEVHKNKWCHEYVDMRSNSVMRAEERLDVWKCRIEELEAKVFAVGGGRKKGGQALMMSPLLKSIQGEITRYQIRIKVQEYKQQIMDSFLAGLEKSNEMEVENDQHQKEQHQHQGEDGSSSDSDYSASNECPTGGEEASSVDDSEEDLSYIIGREEGLSLIHSVEDSDISETATEEEEESMSSSIPSVQTNTNSPQTTTTATTQRQRHLTVLITGGNFNLTQTANQRSTLQLLADLSLPHVTIDGMDPTHRERRNELFGVSGIRGNYPQIFVSTIVVVGDDNNGDDGNVESEDVFLGGYEWLECCDLDELRELLVVKGESGRDGNAGEGMKEEPRHEVNTVDIEGHLRSLEKAIKIMEGRVKDFEILSTSSTFNRQQNMYEYDVPSMNAANRLYSLTRQCTNVLENFTTKTSDIISSSLEMQPTALTSNDQDTSANTATADYEVNTTIQQELIIAQIEQTKVHLTQLEQSRDACNADIEQLKNDIESMELAMEEQNESNYELFTEIQTKMGMLTKRLEVGSNEIRGLVKEIKEWSSREEEFLLKAQPSRGIGFIR